MAKALLGGEDVINHYGLVRLRVKGSGNLRMTLFSLDEVNQTVLASTVLNSLTNVEPTTLANFTEQKAKLMIRTTEINETFQISKMIIYTKPVAKSYPG